MSKLHCWVCALGFTVCRPFLHVLSLTRAYNKRWEKLSPCMSGSRGLVWLTSEGHWGPHESSETQNWVYRGGIAPWDLTELKVVPVCLSSPSTGDKSCVWGAGRAQIMLWLTRAARAGGDQTQPHGSTCVWALCDYLILCVVCTQCRNFFWNVTMLS